MSKYIKVLPILAVVAGVSAAFAFDNPTSIVHSADPIEWLYDGTGSETTPSNYFEASVDPCDGSQDICGISAPRDPDNPNQPVIDANLQQQITTKTGPDVFLEN